MGSLDVDSLFKDIPLGETMDMCVNLFRSNIGTDVFRV